MHRMLRRRWSLRNSIWHRVTGGTTEQSLHCFRKSEVFVQKFSNFRIKKKDTLATPDVVSSFSKVPLEDTPQTLSKHVHSRLKTHQTGSENHQQFVSRYTHAVTSNSANRQSIYHGNLRTRKCRWWSRSRLFKTDAAVSPCTALTVAIPITVITLWLPLKTTVSVTVSFSRRTDYENESQHL